MNNMRYRFRLEDARENPPERPVQAFFNSKEEGLKWAEAVLKANDNLIVYIYETFEIIQGALLMAPGDDGKMRVQFRTPSEPSIVGPAPTKAQS